MKRLGLVRAMRQRSAMDRVVALFACVLLGCGGDLATDGGVADAGARADAASDAGRDAGRPDAGDALDGGDIPDDAGLDAGSDGGADAGGPTWPTEITRVSVSSAGDEANGGCTFPSISPDGRFVAFRSRATNLVADDTNGATDIFVHDRATGATERVSVANDGAQADGDSLFSAISEDGRYVAFASDATNLVPGDDNGVRDVFVRDRVAGTTERVSVATDGTESDAAPSHVDLSADGRFVVWDSAASTLVADDPNPDVDVFLRDRDAGTTVLVSRAPIGGPVISSLQPRITADGAHVFFTSGAALTAGDTDTSGDVYRYATATGEQTLITEGDVAAARPGPSEDGRFVVFGAADGYASGDANGEDDLYIRELGAAGVTRVSVVSGGEPDGASRVGLPLTDGRTVVFLSDALNLVPGTPAPPAARLYAYDLVDEVVTRLDRSASGEAGDGWLESSFFHIDVAGRSVVFASRSTNLVPGDGNDTWDIFVLDVPAP